MKWVRQLLNTASKLPTLPLYILAALFASVSLIGIILGLIIGGTFTLLDNPSPDNLIATSVASALVTADIQATPVSQATHTPQPATHVPALDVVTLLANSDAQRVIPPCQNQITIDAQTDDWAALTDFRIAIRINTYGSTFWTGIDDTSGEALLCWNDDALHLFVTIRDDVHVQTSNGRNIYLGDEIELLLDTDLEGDATRTLWDADDIQLILSAANFANTTGEAVQYRPTFIADISITLATRQENQNGNYIIEAAIPWSQLHMTPQPDQLYRMCIALSDNDQINRASQDSMVSHCAGLRVDNPTTWDTVAFVR